MEGNTQIKDRYGYEKNGYEIAQLIDTQLNELLEASPPSEANYLQWLRVARTIATSCAMIEEGCKQFRK